MRQPIGFVHGWRFVAALLAMQFLPPYTLKGYDLRSEWWTVASQAIHHPLFAPASVYVAFKLVPVLLIGLAIAWPGPGRRILAGCIAINCVGFILHQTIGWTARYGLVVDTVDTLMFALVALTWARDALRRPIEPDQTPWSWSTCWLLPLALLALWYPLNPETLLPDFHWRRTLTNGAGLAFCTMTSLYLAVFLCCWPKSHRLSIWVTSVVGLIAALWNMVINFVQLPSLLWWNGVLHLPLLIISAFGIYLSRRQTPMEPAGSF